MEKRWVVALLSIVAGCSGEPHEGETTVTAPDPIQYPATVPPTVAATPPAHYAPEPDHLYDERRGDTYFYVAAVSDHDRENGRAVGNVHQFQYLGRNAEGEHILASLGDNGLVTYRAKCARRCRIIDTTYGGKIAFSTESIIGAAFQDAFNGKLRVAQWAENERQPTPSPVPTMAANTPKIEQPASPAPPSSESPTPLSVAPTAAATLPPLDPRFVEPAPQTSVVGN